VRRTGPEGIAQQEPAHGRFVDTGTQIDQPREVALPARVLERLARMTPTGLTRTAGRCYRRHQQLKNTLITRGGGVRPYEARQPAVTRLVPIPAGSTCKIRGCARMPCLSLHGEVFF